MPLTLAFKALNDKTRRDILELLRKKDRAAGDIAAMFEMSQPSISHHLEILRRAGLVESRKVGQFVIYSLNMTVMDEIMSWMVQFGKEKKKKKHKNK